MEILGTKQELHRNNPGTQGGILRYDPGAGHPDRDWETL